MIKNIFLFFIIITKIITKSYLQMILNVCKIIFTTFFIQEIHQSPFFLANKFSLHKSAFLSEKSLLWK